MVNIIDYLSGKGYVLREKDLKDKRQHLIKLTQKAKAAVPSASLAQEILTLEEVVRITLENNYNILISRNDAEIAERNVNRANAGMFPAVSGSLNNNNTIQNSTQTRSTGEVK